MIDCCYYTNFFFIKCTHSSKGLCKRQTFLLINQIRFFLLLSFCDKGYLITQIRLSLYLVAELQREIIKIGGPNLEVKCFSFFFFYFYNSGNESACVLCVVIDSGNMTICRLTAGDIPFSTNTEWILHRQLISAFHNRSRRKKQRSAVHEVQDRSLAHAARTQNIRFVLPFFFLFLSFSLSLCICCLALADNNNY